MTFRVFYSTQFLGHLSDHQLLKSNPVSVNNNLGRAHDLYIHAADMNLFIFSLFTSAQEQSLLTSELHMQYCL
jgi:hypothetical protein